jgi:hypothetical protein
MVDGYAELEALCAHTGGRRRSLNLRDPVVPGGALTTTVRFQCRARSCGIATNGSWMQLNMRVETSLCFAAIRPDPVLALRRPVDPIGGVKVFVGTDGRVIDALHLWSGGKENARLLKLTALSGCEAVRLARNGIDATFRAVDMERQLKLVDTLADLAGSLPPDHAGGRAEDVRLPENLSSLAILLDSWAIDDDQERTERVESADVQELTRLIAGVEPHLAAIDRLFLEDQNAAVAAVTGRLAEACIEARQELKARATP